MEGGNGVEGTGMETRLLWKALFYIIIKQLNLKTHPKNQKYSKTKELSCVFS